MGKDSRDYPKNQEDTAMTLGEFIWDRMGHLAVLGIFAAAATVFLLATGTQWGILVILLFFGGFLLLAVQFRDFLKCRSHIRELESVLNGLDQKYLFMECIPKPDSAYEQALFEMLRRAGRDMIENVSNARAATREYKEYIESWVHEIKTPITAARLICRNVDRETGRRLTAELAQIDNHVERALYYARAESPEQDFLVRRTALDTIAAEAIERHRSLLIQNSVCIRTENLDPIVYTDGKWLCFILGQLLQNAVRYRNEHPLITLSARHAGSQVLLTVSDNGIGIPAHELSRIFDRGFTGTNGRLRNSSTGMGLYLCKKLADHLEIQLSVQSSEGQGTAVTLTFPAVTGHGYHAE